MASTQARILQSIDWALVMFVGAAFVSFAGLTSSGAIKAHVVLDVLSYHWDFHIP